MIYVLLCIDVITKIQYPSKSMKSNPGLQSTRLIIICADCCYCYTRTEICTPPFDRCLGHKYTVFENDIVVYKDCS